MYLFVAHYSFQYSVVDLSIESNTPSSLSLRRSISDRSSSFFDLSCFSCFSCFSSSSPSSSFSSLSLSFEIISSPVYDTSTPYEDDCTDLILARTLLSLSPSSSSSSFSLSRRRRRRHEKTQENEPLLFFLPLSVVVSSPPSPFPTSFSSSALVFRTHLRSAFPRCTP